MYLKVGEWLFPWKWPFRERSRVFRVFRSFQVLFSPKSAPGIHVGKNLPQNRAKTPFEASEPQQISTPKKYPPNSSPHDGHPPKIQNLQTYPTKSGIIPIWTSPSSGRSSIWTPPSSEIDSFDPLDSHEIDSFDPLDSQKSMIIAMKSTFIAFKPLNPDLPTEGGGWLVTKQYINCVEFEKNV